MSGSGPVWGQDSSLPRLREAPGLSYGGTPWDKAVSKVLGARRARGGDRRPSLRLGMGGSRNERTQRDRAYRPQLARASALKSSVDERLVQLFRQLGLDRVHLVARVTADWRGLATPRPETIASLTLVCPTGLDATPLGALASRVLVLTGDQG